MLGEPDNRTWIIKRMPCATADLALECAAERGMRLSQWLTEAVSLAAETQRNARVVLPDDRPSPPQESTLGDIAHLLESMARVAEASGVPVPRYARAAAYRLARERLRLALTTS